MTGFLEEQGVYDAQRLPTEAVLPVIAALWQHLPENPDALGNAKTLLRKYLWRSFFTERYEQSAGTAALNDFRALRDVLKGEKDESSIPILKESEYPLPTEEKLILAGWPKSKTILGRAILGLAIKCGARDIADDAPPTREHLRQREYHHLYPDAILRSVGMPNNRIFCALNCALITWRTNRKISCKEPVVYLRERAEANTLGEDDLKRRLKTHLIPYSPLLVGGYEGLDEQAHKKKVEADYQAFLEARARIVKRAMDTLCTGREIDINRVFEGEA